jgi:hypothetical protein
MCREGDDSILPVPAASIRYRMVRIGIRVRGREELTIERGSFWIRARELLMGCKMRVRKVKQLPSISLEYQ